MDYTYLTNTSEVGKINVGSYFDEQHQELVNQSVASLNTFGSSDADIIEVGILDLSENLIKFDTISQKLNYSVISGNSKNVDNVAISYSYPRFNTIYKSNLNNLLLPINRYLYDLDIKTGVYKIVFNFTRHVCGSPTNGLFIKNISPSRTEIKLSPVFDTKSDSPEIVKETEKYLRFLKKKIFITDVIGITTAKLFSLEMADSISEYIKTADTVEVMKAYFGLKSDADISRFIYDIYTGYSIDATHDSAYIGIKTYILEFLYANYNYSYTGSELTAQIEYIVSKAIDFQLKQKNPTVNQQFLDVARDMFTVIYTNSILPVMGSIISEYITRQYSYFKTALNFGNGNLIRILTHDWTEATAVGSPNELIIKLDSPLPEQYTVKTFCWISNIAIQPVVQNIQLVSTPKVQTFPIAGPDFSTQIGKYTANTEKFPEYSTYTDIPQELQVKVDINSKSTDINIDYSKFENFIVYSSSELRTKLFKNKLSKLTSYSAEVDRLQSEAAISTDVISASYVSDVTDLTTQIYEIKNSFDGYESYLYNNPTVISGSLTNKNSNYYNYIQSASIYDFNNRDSLINNTPDYIITDENNEDYLIFLSMIGHHFDNIWVYLNKFPKTSNLNNSADEFPKRFLNDMLISMGWDQLQSAVENAGLENAYLHNQENTGSQFSSSLQSYNDTLLKRLLINLPAIYNKKGTNESIKTIMNCYGIPSELIDIREYGTSNKITTQDSFYDAYKKLFFTQFSSSSEYIKIYTSASFNSVECVVSLKNNGSLNQYDRFNIIEKESDWKIEAIKDREDKFGYISFSITSGSNTQTMVSDKLPIFNGNFYNIAITKTPYITSEPLDYYDLYVKSFDGNFRKFSSHTQLVASNTYGIPFGFSGSIYFGNFSTNKLNGTIDKINVWKTSLNEDDIETHGRNFESISDSHEESTYNNLLFRYSFEYPVNLYSATNTASITNYNEYYSGSISSSAYAVNFQNNNVDLVNCIETSGSIYPYQFSEITLLQSFPATNFGPNKINNDKVISYTQESISDLTLTPYNSSVLNRNSVGTDSNVVGVFISPFKRLDDEIINFIGNNGIIDIIGDPDTGKHNYDGLKSLRDSFNKISTKRVYFQEFMTLYRYYFNNSFFDSVKKVIPARVKYLSGLVIEPSILDRQKFDINTATGEGSIGKDMSFTDISTLSSSMIYEYNSSGSNTSYGVITSGDIITEYDDQNFSQYIIGFDPDDKSYAFCSSDGLYSLMEHDGFSDYVVARKPKYDSYTSCDGSAKFSITGSNWVLVPSASYASNTSQFPIIYTSGSHHSNNLSKKRGIHRNTFLSVDRNYSVAYTRVEHPLSVYLQIQNDSGVSDADVKFTVYQRQELTTGGPYTATLYKYSGGPTYVTAFNGGVQQTISGLKGVTNTSDARGAYTLIVYGTGESITISFVIGVDSSGTIIKKTTNPGYFIHLPYDTYNVNFPHALAYAASISGNDLDMIDITPTNQANNKDTNTITFDYDTFRTRRRMIEFKGNISGYTSGTGFIRSGSIYGSGNFEDNIHFTGQVSLGGYHGVIRGYAASASIDGVPYTNSKIMTNVDSTGTIEGFIGTIDGKMYTGKKSSKDVQLEMGEMYGTLSASYFNGTIDNRKGQIIAFENLNGYADGFFEGTNYELSNEIKTGSIFIKSKNTIFSTTGESGITDYSLPIISTNTN